jgi:hypothetical protein
LASRLNLTNRTKSRGKHGKESSSIWIRGAGDQGPGAEGLFHGVAAHGLLITKKKRARIKNMKGLVLKQAKRSFNLGPINLGRMKRHAASHKSAIVEKTR